MRKLDTERGAAWLAHQSGGLGVAGSNPAAPTSKFNSLGPIKVGAVLVQQPNSYHGAGLRVRAFVASL